MLVATDLLSRGIDVEGGEGGREGGREGGCRRELANEHNHLFTAPSLPPSFPPSLGIAWVINFDMPFQPRVARSDEEGNTTDTG